MGAKSRRKGAAGEREVVALARKHGFLSARREAPMQAGYAHAYPDVSGVGPLWLEVKSYKRTPVNGFTRELLSRELPGFVPVLAWRDDRTEWRASLSLDELLKLLRMAYPPPPQIRTVEIE